MKTAAVTGAVGALGLGCAHNMAPSDKAWADNDVHEVRTSCRACIANCGVIATVSNGRVVKLRGDSIDPMSKGRMCPKGLSGIQALYHPNRNKYPMKRVGAKPGNQWERISWDEAAKTVAQHMIDMRDKTGKHGLLCTTGGGGNPQFFSPPRFRNFWGAGNVFEPGCAQCYLPRNFTMPLVNGISDTSIADSGCSELYKPAKYGGLTEVYVIWGTGPAWHSPSTSGRCVAELRENGCKTVVVDPRFTADASKADVWLPIKPGTDMAMMLGWMHYIIENKLYEKIPGYETFCEQWTNLPFLVDPRDNVSLPPVAEDITKDGQLLRASAVFDDVDATNEGYVYFDTEKGEVTKAFALGPDNDGTYHPQMFGTVDVKLKDGSTITCKTAFEAYKDRCADFDLDTVAEITGCKKEKIIEAIELYCSSAHGGISLGVATDMYPGSAQAAIGAAALDCMTAHLWHPGCPANKVGGQGSKGLTSCESTIFPSGFIGETKYQFQTNDAILERLGYCEHKGRGGWMHSHIPTVRNAIATGEPFKPRVWFDMSGNKLAMLGNAKSWYDVFPEVDYIIGQYPMLTSFHIEACDLVFPLREWLEEPMVNMTQLDTQWLQNECVHIGETVSHSIPAAQVVAKCREMWGGHIPNGLELGDGTAYLGSATEAEVKQGVADTLGAPDWETLQANTDEYVPFVTPDYWNYNQHEQIADDGLPSGFATESRKVETYCQMLIRMARNGYPYCYPEPQEACEDYSPICVPIEPVESPYEGMPGYDPEYPFVLTSGRVPYFHHGTMRHAPFSRELFPCAEIRINPASAKELGIEHMDWVKVTSRRGEVHARAYLTEGVHPKTVWMERFWNPECFDASQANPTGGWRECNVNVLTKNDAPFNEVYGSYTNRGFTVKIEKSERPANIWVEAEEFEPFMPTQEMLAEAQTKDVF